MQAYAKANRGLRRKVKEATKALLSGTDLPISKIVEDWGFSDSSNFSRSFKARFGMTPMQFRKQYR